MRVWIDVSNSPQVPFFLPLLALLEQRGHEIHVTTRDYAQTIELLRLHDVAHDVVGPPHGGASALGKGRAAVGRIRALRAHVKRRGIELALSHASHELPLVARSLGIPSAYAFDYEFARVQHGVGCRAATRVVVPSVIPQDRLARLGASPRKVRRFPGHEEEYYLAGFEPDRSVLERLALDTDRILVVVRTPPDVSLYHRYENPLFAEVLARIGSERAAQAVVLPRTAKQREAIRALGLPSLVVPQHAVDARSLVALSDLVVSAGGTMNREAAALGVPAYTTFAARMGAVDEALVHEGKLRVVGAAGEIPVERRPAGAPARVERDPALLLDLLLGAR